jgi:hypothetical protein
MNMQRILTGVMIAGALVIAPVAAMAFPNLSPSACGWKKISSPNAMPDANDLLAVTAISATDAWAGGYYKDASSNDQPLFEHWNGTKWSIVSSPAIGYSFIYGMTAIATNDVWAVGSVYDSVHSAFQNESWHWDGSSWSIVGVPSLGFVNNFLFGVAATSSSDVWVVGAYNKTSTVRGTVIGHWNKAGGSWILAAGPIKGTGDNALVSVAAITSKNAWAVGEATATRFQTLTEHWTGTMWKVVASPDVNANDNPLNSVTAVSKNDVWAVGDFYTGTIFNTLAEHWTGSSWAIVPSPNKGSNSTALFSTTAVSTTDVWAVGEYQNGAYVRTYTMNWNGSAWSTVVSPNVGSFDSFLNSASRIPGTQDAWAVGGTSNADHSNHQTLIEKFHC